MKKTIEELLQTPYWIIDILPMQVPMDGPGQYFAVERFFLREEQLAAIKGKPLNLILRLLYPRVEPVVMEAGRIYLRIVTLSFPANALYKAGAALYRSMGRTRVTMYVSLSMNLLDVAGNAIGIFVLHAGAGSRWPSALPIPAPRSSITQAALRPATAAHWPSSAQRKREA